MGIKLVSRSQASKVSKHVNLQAGHYINIFFALSSHSRRSMNRLLVKLLSLWLKLLPRRLAIKVYCWVADFLQDLFPIVDQCWLNEYVHVYVYCIEVFSCVAQISNKKFNRYSCQDEAPPTEETEEQQEALSNTLMYYYNIKLIPKIWNGCLFFIVPLKHLLTLDDGLFELLEIDSAWSATPYPSIRPLLKFKLKFQVRSNVPWMRLGGVWYVAGHIYNFFCFFGDSIAG